MSIVGLGPQNPANRVMVQHAWLKSAQFRDDSTNESSAEVRGGLAQGRIQRASTFTATDGFKKVMRIFTQKWRDGFLDEALLPDTCRIMPHLWVNVMPVDGLFFVRRKSFRLLWNYFMEIGLKNLLLKVASRWRERHRNVKWLSYGVGKVVEGAPGCPWPKGAQVAFLAPSHPRCMERVVLPFELIKATQAESLASDRLRYVSTSTDIPPDLGRLAGWSVHSGIPIDTAAVQSAMDALPVELKDSTDDGLFLKIGSSVKDTKGKVVSPRRKPAAILIGYGNYAKTVILPSIKPWISVCRIHELDPTQIGRRPGKSVIWDTAPTLRESSTSDVVIVAGYHHTHAAITVAALERGAAVILEKPLATSMEQLAELRRTVEADSGPVFCCFQKRYSPFNAFVRGDLEAEAGSPLDYYCVVYEEPLPPRHWYTWPSSRSRLVSNGCHWIDHFLFLNGFAKVARIEATVASSGALNVSMELENRAHFTMVLSDRGSPRVGLQDYIELRCDGGTATIRNSTHYTAERHDRVVRRAKVRRLDSHAAMYRTIAERVASGERGDSAHSLAQSAGVTLYLEDQIRPMLGFSPHPPL